MSKRIKVSVIIPVHNGAAYIKDTMQCIVNQSFQELEIILVDDGSTDNTVDIIKEFQATNPQIQYLYQEKANAGVARNRGMEKAVGDYLLFLDGDDLFENNIIERMYNKIIEDDGEVCVCNADQYDTEKKILMKKAQYLRKSYLPEVRPFSRKEIGSAILYFTTSVPWNKMVKKEFLEKNKIRFQDIERANDQYFSIMVLILAERITVVEDILVHYRVKQKGNLTTEFSDTPLCAYEAMVEVEKELQKSGLLNNKDIRQAFDNKVLNLMIYSLNIQNSLAGYQQLYDTITQGGMEKMGVVLREKEYYFNELEYNNFVNMSKLTCDEFLFVKNREYRDTIAKKNLRYKTILEEKKEVLKSLRRTEKELKSITERKWYKIVMKLLKIYGAIFGKNRVKNEIR